MAPLMAALMDPLMAALMDPLMAPLMAALMAALMDPLMAALMAPLWSQMEEQAIICLVHAAGVCGVCPSRSAFESPYGCFCVFRFEGLVGVLHMLCVCTTLISSPPPTPHAHHTPHPVCNSV